MEEFLAEGKCKLKLVKGDLTALKVDAIVFYAEPSLALGAGFGTAITVRGGPSIKKELEGLGPLQTGQVVTTNAGKLEADYIIHAVGPRFQEDALEEKLRRTVENVLIEASRLSIRSIAFPPMGTGFYGIPLEMCAQILVETLRNFIQPETSLEEVVICVLDNREQKPFAERLQNTLQEAVI